MKNCESCGMPLKSHTMSHQDNRYCIYCQDQTTGVLKTFQEVRTGSIEAAVRHMGKTQEEATKMADEMLPQLPRWSK